MTADLPTGTRVRLKTRTMSGWRGKATILLPYQGKAIKDGWTPDGTWSFDGYVEACRHEWAVLRDQTPNPEHATALSGIVGTKP